MKKNDSHLSPIIFFILYYKIFSEVGKASSVDKLKNLAIIVNKENFFPEETTYVFMTTTSYSAKK